MGAFEVFWDFWEIDVYVEFVLDFCEDKFLAIWILDCDFVQIASPDDEGFVVWIVLFCEIECFF